MPDLSALLPDPPPGLGSESRPEALAPEAIAGVLAGLSSRTPDLLHACALLWHDHLDAAHRLVMRHQGDRLADTLHAILHRREHDEGNALYWWRQVGVHPLAAELGREAVTLGLAALVKPNRHLDARLMTQAVCRGSADAQTLRCLQAAELRLLGGTLLGP